MCLDSKSRTAPEKTGYFYKIFLLSHKTEALKPPIYNAVCKRGKWIKSAPGTIKMDFCDDRSYPAGFHGYKTLEDAKKAFSYYGYRVIIKCRYAGGHTQGHQNRRMVIVASKIYIPKNPKDLSGHHRPIKRR